MRTLLLLLVVAAITGCHRLDSPSSEGPVSLVVALDHRLFADDALLDVEVWNAEGLAALDANSRCAAVNDPAGASRIQCPPGVTFKDVVPERFSFPLPTLGASVELTARSVSAGEMFRIRLSALGRDRCNPTSADVTRRASSGRMMLGELDWQTSLRGCVNPPPR
jgi:hypothetical protein